ncbi:MAG: glycosyltransferase family 4 protein [Ktedonobacteraceae bacterium]|nr:glycosyltransferase family 4 protein [Ktedonobacteraceae bacterium]
MKLLQVVWNFPDTVMRPFDMYYFYWPMQEARLRGWDSEVLTFQVNSRQPAEEIIDGIHIRRCPSGKRKGRPFSWPFIHALLTTDADIIHCHGYAEGRSELTILLARLRGRPVIFTPHFHVYPKRRPLRELYDRTAGRFFFNMSSRVIVFTHYTCQQLMALGVHPQKLCVVPHVARPDVFHETDAEHKPGQHLLQAGVSGSPLILGVGQLIERKGWEYTVRCLPAVVARFPDAKLLIIGPSQPAEPAFRQRLMALAAELGVSEHIQILQDNTPAFILDAYRSATILTHPSFVESFGMVLLEAMVAKLPVVAHNGTGMPCIVDDQATGYIVDVRDTEAYTQALLALLSDTQLRQHMGEEAWRLALSRFSQQEIAAQLFAIYAEVTGTPGNLPHLAEAQSPMGTTVVHSAKRE